MKSGLQKISTRELFTEKVIQNGGGE